MTIRAPGAFAHPGVAAVRHRGDSALIPFVTGFDAVRPAHVVIVRYRRDRIRDRSPRSPTASVVGTCAAQGGPHAYPRRYPLVQAEFPGAHPARTGGNAAHGRPDRRRRVPGNRFHLVEAPARWPAGRADPRTVRRRCHRREGRRQRTPRVSETPCGADRAPAGRGDVRDRAPGAGRHGRACSRLQQRGREPGQVLPRLRPVPARSAVLPRRPAVLPAAALRALRRHVGDVRRRVEARAAHARLPTAHTVERRSTGACRHRLQHRRLPAFERPETRAFQRPQVLR